MDMDKYVGRLLDNRYEILEPIGVGGMAVVYKARCHRLNRLVAIKILKDDFFQDEELRRRFHAESQAVAMLSHANIVSVYDVSSSDSADYIVMELIDGISLKQYMEKKGVLNWKETLHFAIQIGKALEHAHSRGIVHRDIKPHNVMVLKNGSVKVADFGIARVMSKSNTLTKEALGSVHYISPEQAKGGRVDSRSDLYSLGVVMYEMMTGRPPFDGETPVAVAIQHINGTAPMPSTINPSIPGGLEQIIMKAMVQNAANRYPTAAAMLYDMDEFRKNPAILFDYNNPVTDIDAAIQISGNSRKQDEPVPAPEAVPEKPAERRRPAAQPDKPKQRKSAPPRRRREEVVEEESESNSKVATVAIILCTVVALVAIGIFVFAMVNGGLGSNDNIVVVPKLLGMTEDEIDTTDFAIRVKERRYHDIYAEGQIYKQTPKEGTKIAKGGIVTVYVSLGAEPENKVMEDLVKDDTDETAAILFLTDVLGIQEENITVYYENSATKPEGMVIRTNPVKGEALTEGQKVELWISLGPTAKVSKVPNVSTGKLTLEQAEELLNYSGFYNIIYEEVISNHDAGMVVRQSEEPQTELDVTVQIILQVSLGPEGSLPGSDFTEPQLPPVDPELVTKIVTVELPEELIDDYVVSLWLGNEMVAVRSIPVGTLSTQFSLTGKGIVQYTVKINDSVENGWTINVNFNE